MDPVAVLEAAALSEQQGVLAALAQGESELQRFYKHSVLLLTGASGFLGKQLAEKLLRSCDISRIYVLLRPKKGVCIEKRIEDLTNDSVFEYLRKQKPNFSEKIKAIEGDISELRLGIKDRDWKAITEEVNVVFHLAATTKLNESLQSATLINVRGTREALHLAINCKKLKSFVHVSTAYSSATTELVGADVQEGFYHTPVTPGTLIRMAETMDTTRLNDMTHELYRSGWRNTYTFTKAIAEQQVRLMSAGLPVCIVRPAAVVSSYREPSPGWVDQSCLYGFMGLMLGGFLGIKRTYLADGNKKSDFIPCDYVNNTIIAAAKQTATSQLKGGNHTKIYTVCSACRNPVTYRMIFDYFDMAGRKIPSPKSAYYSIYIYTKNKYWYRVLALFLQVIPAHIADFVGALFGKQRRLVKLLDKASGMLDLISSFTTNDWNFIDSNVESLYNSLTKQDQAIFNFDATNIDWKDMCLRICYGLRKHIIKDDLKNTENVITKQKYLRVFNYVLVTMYGYGIWKLTNFLYSLINKLLCI